MSQVWKTRQQVRENRSLLWYTIYIILFRSVKLIFVLFIFFLFLFLIWFLWWLVRIVFNGARAFNSDVSGWNVARVTSMRYSTWTNPVKLFLIHLYLFVWINKTFYFFLWIFQLIFSLFSDSRSDLIFVVGWFVCSFFGCQCFQFRCL